MLESSLELFEIVRLSSFDDTHLIFHIRISFLIQLALAVYYLLFSFQSTTENLLDFLSIYSDLHHFRECQNIRFGGLKRTRTSLSLYSYKVRALSVSILILVNWWAQEDSNLRPHASQACALTT